MLWTKGQAQALGLKQKERQLLEALHTHGTLNTLTLAFEAKVARVTAMRLLASLNRRGFVGRQTLKNEVRWSLVRPDLLVKRLQKTFEDAHGLSAKNALALSDVASISLYRGPEELLASNKKFLIGHAGERLYVIEPNGIWRYVAKAPAKDWIHLNSLVKQKKIIIELLLEEGYEQALEHLHPSLRESMLSLSPETRVLPKGSISSSTEVLIFRDSALFLDWEQFVGVEIKNPGTVRLIKGMFDLLRSLSRPA